MENIEPLVYRISLEPDLDRFTFDGRLTLEAEAAAPVETISLNALELTVHTCSVETDGKSETCRFDLDPDREILAIHPPEPVSGRFSLRIAYQGEINDKMAGFYRSGYRDAQGTLRHLAITQFQESDARRAFPCFDQPVKKAVFEIEMTVDDALAAVSNTTVKAAEPAGPGKRRVVFHPTPRMSTYLVFFGVGPFVTVPDEADPRVRVLCLPGSESYAGFGRDFGVKALTYCEDYYAIPYPLPKLDLIAVPDFAFGAMENWGAVTFRENLLLHYPGITSRAGEERICEVIAHEIAHQWFGNLVTPSDWKYLWLNESFATYFGFGAVDHHHPDWGVWDQFLNGQTDGALARDALHETFPIEIPGGEHVVINSSTAPIIYSKGGSLLRQIEGWIGPDAFRAGLRRYLERFAYGCAASHHLWEGFEAASEAPVRGVIQNWVGQPGHPVVEARRAGDTLELTQRRFTYLPNDSDQTWEIPVSVRVADKSGNARRRFTLLTGRTGTLDLGPDVAWYKVNDGQTGFYRVDYTDTADLQALGSAVRAGTLPPTDRWGVQNDRYALVRRGAVPLGDYLAFLDHYRKETAPLPLSSIAGNLFGAYLVLGLQGGERIAAFGRPFLERVLGGIGYEPRPEESHATSALREAAIWQAALYGSTEAAGFGAERFRDLTAGRPVAPDILKSVMQVGARELGSEAFEWLAGRIDAAQSEHERLNILSAMGCFREPETIKRSLDHTLAEVPARNRFIPIVASAVNPFAIPLLWDWYQENRAALEGMHPMLYERVVVSMITACGLDRPDAIRRFFGSYVEDHPRLRDAVALSLERLEIGLRMREAALREAGA